MLVITVHTWMLKDDHQTLCKLHGRKFSPELKVSIECGDFGLAWECVRCVSDLLAVARASPPPPAALPPDHFPIPWPPIPQLLSFTLATFLATFTTTTCCTPDHFPIRWPPSPPPCYHFRYLYNSLSSSPCSLYTPVRCCVVATQWRYPVIPHLVLLILIQEI